jgi:hypothetical protein
MALLEETAVFGPPRAEVFDPVPRRDYVHAILRDTGTVNEYLPFG